MTASSSVVSLSNRALLSVGAQATISNLNEGSTESDAINILFVPCFEQLARTAAWNCLRQQVTLSLLAAATGTPENPTGTPPLPPSPWLYQYALPSNNLQIRFLVPSLPSVGVQQTYPGTAAATCYPGGSSIPFAVAYATDSGSNPEGVILTNQASAQAVYTVNDPNPTVWDSLFESAFVATLAAFLVPALSLNFPLMDRSIKQAEAAIAMARTRDGNEGDVVQDSVPDWIRARGIGGYTNYGNYQYNTWSNMCWPG